MFGIRTEVLLLCLCFPWPPDEHQIVQFILAFKGTASISDGAGQVVYGILIYYLCARSGTCSAGNAPGTGVSSAYVILDLYQEVLVWAVCFLLLPRSLPYLNRSTAAPGPAQAQKEDFHKGGRMNALLQYNLLVFAFSLSIFLVLCGAYRIAEAELVKLEAAARQLAELLTRAETLAEREVAEAHDLMLRKLSFIANLARRSADITALAVLAVLVSAWQRLAALAVVGGLGTASFSHAIDEDAIHAVRDLRRC
eukprot:Skav234421  [mRNA]  locus=scaffold4957:56567:64247:- [translate_table: standard]